MKAGVQEKRDSAVGESRETDERREPFRETAFFEKILVPVDFSDDSLRALEYACHLGKRHGAFLHLIHVVEPTPFLSEGDMAPLVVSDREIADHCEHQLARVARERSCPDLPISSAVRIGRPAHEITAVAGEMDANLIVVSTHGYTGLKHLLLGSTAERIVREARCPVLVVRSQGQSRSPGSGSTAAEPEIRKILVPTDFSTRSIETLRCAIGFARQFGASITLVHCVHLAATFGSSEYAAYDTGALIEASLRSARRACTKLLRDELPRDVEGNWEVRVGPPLAEIPELATKGRYDLIMCATKGYSGLKHTLLGSTAEGIIRYAPCPVLICRRRPAPQEHRSSQRMAITKSGAGEGFTSNAVRT